MMRLVASRRAVGAGALLALCWLVRAVGATKAPADSFACPSEAVCLRAEQCAQAGIKSVAIEPAEGVSSVRIGGRIAFDDLKVAHVVSPLSGRVASVQVALGQEVKKGAVLAVLHAPQMASILADAASARADLVAAERNFAREKSLFAERAVALKEYEGAQNRLAQAKATAAQAAEKRQLLGAHEHDASDTYVLRAPIDGSVVARNVVQNAEVQGLYDAGKDAPALFTIGSLETVWAVGDAFPLDAAAIRPGNPAEVSVTAYPERQYTSQVEWLAANVDAQSNTVRLRCRLANTEHLLKPDMTASLRITTAQQKGLWVPERAVFQVGGTPWVFVEAPAPSPWRVFSRRAVKIARASADRRFLLGEGLQAGEQVVTERGIFLLGVSPE